MLNSFTSAKCIAEDTSLGSKMAESIIPIRHLAKEVDWRNKTEIYEFLQNRFQVNSLSSEERLKIYADLMMALSIEGLVFSIETRCDFRKMRNGYDADTIQGLLLPNSERKGSC